MEKKDQIESKPWPEVDVDSIPSLKKLTIVKDPNLRNDKDPIYYDYDKYQSCFPDWSGHKKGK